MFCTTAINTSNTIRTQTGASGLDTNSCYYVITIAVQVNSVYVMRSVNRPLRYPLYLIVSYVASTL